MYQIETTEEFDNWLDSMKDGKTQKVIVKRIRTMSLGTLGKVRSLKKGLFEAKIDYGPGYRMYFINKGKKIIILLCGGDKTDQDASIDKARKMAEELFND